MLKNKVKELTVNSDALFKISIKLLDQYNIEPTITFLLLLSYLTVKEYSRYHDHLDKAAKVDLSLQYIPDLMQSLTQAKIIDVPTYSDCKMLFDNHQDMMKDILETYYVIFSYKNDHKIVKSNTWFSRFRWLCILYCMLYMYFSKIV